MNSRSFRQMFPALARQAWLDTAASAPGATPVTSALASAIASWQEGSLGAADWEAAAPRARAGFAHYLGVPQAHVALMGSVAEAAATVAASLPSRGGARLLGNRLRVGFHYFNNDEDLAAALGALRG